MRNTVQRVSDSSTRIKLAAVVATIDSVADSAIHNFRKQNAEPGDSLVSVNILLDPAIHQQVFQLAFTRRSCSPTHTHTHL